MPTPAQAPDVLALLAALQTSDPGRPRITWYGSGTTAGERVELSARVLANWVAKSANLLVEEFDAGPGVGVALRLPADHWRTAAIGLAVLATGAELQQEPVDVRITVEGEPEGDLVVAVPALARSATPAPTSGLDYAAVITGYGDVFVTATSTALPRTPPQTPPGGRIVLGTPADAMVLVEQVVDVLRADGSVLLGEVSDHVAQQELVTGT